MSVGYGDLKKGMSIEMDGEPYSVVEYERSKMQQRAPVMRIRFRNLKTGKVVDKTFSGYDVSFTPADVQRRKAQYIYKDEDFCFFEDPQLLALGEFCNLSFLFEQGTACSQRFFIMVLVGIKTFPPI